MKTYQKITENSTKNSPKNKRTHQKILNRCCCNLHFILFRTHEGVTDTGIKFNLVIQMALQHILVQRFKQLLSERYLKLRNIRIQFEFGKIRTRATPNTDSFCAVQDSRFQTSNWKATFWFYLGSNWSSQGLEIHKEGRVHAD